MLNKETRINKEKKSKTLWDDVYKNDNLPWMGKSIPDEILNTFLEKTKEGDTILDYGCGDGFYSEIFKNRGLKVTGADISSVALEKLKNKIPEIETINTSHPKIFYDRKNVFDHLFVWGVMHHIKKNEWDDYLKYFRSIIKKGGFMFIGGHSNKNIDFSNGCRISPTTGMVSSSVDDLGKMAEEFNFKEKNSGIFEFKESSTKSVRVLKFFILESI